MDLSVSLVDKNSVIEPELKVQLQWDNLKYTVTQTNPKTKEQYQNEILKGISGQALPGDFISIMGSSGAGKTTFMNILAQRLRRSEFGCVSGDLSVNDQDVKKIPYRNFIGYVTQDDVLMDTMTVKEAILFSARLRANLSLHAANERTDSIIESLGLSLVKNSIIGSVAIKGISGGEKKRTAIGVELVTQPSILFLDEPTSGLDSFTARNLIKLLLQQAQAGRTIICTIHQPSSDIFYLFDRLILLSCGNCLYQGPAQNSTQYFASLGYECPRLSNPADYFMMIMHVNNRDNLNEEELEFLDKMVSSYKSQSQAHRNINEDLADLTVIKKQQRIQSSFFLQFYMIWRRLAKDYLRNPYRLRVRFIVMTFIAVLVDLTYHNLGKGNSSIQNRNGLLFFLMLNLIMSQLQTIIVTFPVMRQVFIKEYSDRMYGVLPFFLSKMAVELYDEFVNATLITVLVYWVADLNPEVTHFFTFCNFQSDFICMLLSMTGSSFGIMCGCMFSRVDVAVSIAPMISFPFVYFCGFLRNNQSIPIAFRWIQWISVFKYGFQALMLNEYDGLDTDFTVNEFGEIPDPIKDLNITFTVWGNIGLLALVMIALRVVAYGALTGMVKRQGIKQ